MADQLTDEQIEEFREAFMLFSGSNENISGAYATHHNVTATIDLVETAIVSEIFERDARVDVMQSFKNNNNFNCECSYFVPMLDGSKIISFEADLNTSIIRGILKEKDEAHDRYKQFIKVGETAILAEHINHGCGVKFRLGNICPKCSFNVKFSYFYQMEITYTNNTRLPKKCLKLSPLLYQQRLYVTSSPPNSSTILTSPAKIYFEIKQHKCFKVTSRNHELHVQEDASKVCKCDGGTYWKGYVLMGDNITPSNQPCYDLHLEIDTICLEDTNADVIADGLCIDNQTSEFAGGYFDISNNYMALNTNVIIPSTCKPTQPICDDANNNSINHSVSLTPKEAVIQKQNSLSKDELPLQLHVSRPNVVLFLIDCSGSMANSMQLAKNALQLSLRSLSLNTKFNIVAFGTNYKCLFPPTNRRYDNHIDSDSDSDGCSQMPGVLYTNNTLQTASLWVDDLQANMNGTELLKPLQDMMIESFTTCFLLTDGRISNSNECFDYVKNRYQQNSCRLYTTGIGDDVDKELVKGLALHSSKKTLLQYFGPL